MLSRAIGVIATGTAATGRGSRPTSTASSRRPDDLAHRGSGTAAATFVLDSIERLRALGIRSALDPRHFVSDDSANTETPSAYDEAIARGLVATDREGDPYLFPSPFPGPPAVSS